MINMSVTNTILIVIGAIVILIGIFTFFNPNISRIINAPGGPKLKAAIAIIVGIIIALIGLIIEIPG
jgi:hypothetical protein